MSGPTQISIQISSADRWRRPARAILGGQNVLGIHLKLRLMRRRHLSAGILLSALLLSAWGQVLAASSCPHMRQEHACCHARVGHDRAAHDKAGDIHATRAVGADCGAGVTASDKPIEECDHCMGRSPRSPQTAMLREVDLTNPGPQFVAPTPASAPSDLALPFTAPVPSREHSPPDASADRHVLISVFRI